MSSYLSRYYRVREWTPSTDHLSPPFVWDRKQSTLLPYETDEWHRLPSGVLVPGIRGGATTSRQLPNRFFPHYSLASTPAQGTLALSSAYTYASAGAAVGWRVILVGNGKTLAAVYFYLTAATGTAANVNDLNFELRDDNAAAGLKPGTTLHTSSSMDPNADTFIGWHKQDPADFAMVQDTYYWAVLADADGNGTDFATALNGLTQVAAPQPTNLLNNSTSADGFATNPTSVGSLVSLVLEFSDGSVMGSSLATSAAPTSDTNRKGFRIGGFTEQISIVGLRMITGSNNISGFEVYADATAPGGATLAAGTGLGRLGSGTIDSAFLSAPYTLAKATAYHAVFTFSAATAAPRKMQIGTTNGHSAILRAARPGGASWYYAIANGTTDWTTDDQDAHPQAILIIEDQVEVAGSGGGGLRLAGHGGLAS